MHVPHVMEIIKINMKVLFILYCLLLLPSWTFSAPPQETELQRLDPHGSKGLNLKSATLDKHGECKVCHRTHEKKLILNPSIPKRCVLCHNRYPHSGVIEHEQRVTCLGCHRSHRALLAGETQKTLPSVKNPSFHIEKPSLTLPEGWIERKNPDPMLRKVCQECHPWR